MAENMTGRLTLVGTPIGNLSDVSPRALEALRNCDFIAAEDTRVSLTLLNHFEIKKPLISYHEHNKRERGAEICQRLRAGENAVLVTDAGLPAISDPGEDLVRLCYEEHIPVGIVPGPCALVTALALSGMPAGRFTFEGFLSVTKRVRREHLLSLQGEQRTMLFYEAPHKLLTTLTDMLTAFGDRPVALVRELTKIHEEVIRTTLQAAVDRFTAEAPRGEFVIIVGGAAPPAEAALTLDETVLLAKDYLAAGQSPAAAAKQAAAETGHKKNAIYRALITTASPSSEEGNNCI